MHPLLKKTVQRTLLSALRAWAGWRIGRDISAASPEAARLLEVVARILGDQFSPEDRAWFARVEAMRETLAASTERIRLLDFGAGTPGSTRTAEEMRRGVAYQSTVGNICRGASKAPFWARLLFALMRAWQTICADSCFAVTLDLHTVGIGVIGASGPRHYRYYLR